MGLGPSIVDQSPSVRAVGILSPSLTGKRCTVAIGDDIETLSNSITVLKQERLARPSLSWKQSNPPWRVNCPGKPSSWAPRT